MRKSLEDIALKIRWANKHIDDFRVAAVDFMRTNPYEILVETDSNAGKRIYTITVVKPVAPQIRLIAGDAIQNLRSALDYLACALVRVTGTEPSKYVCFPISESEPLTKQQQSAFARNVEGMRQDAIDAIKRVKPYKGGDDTLWRLHRLNIIDKHRLLTAAGSCISVVNPHFHKGLRNYLKMGGVLPNPATMIPERFPLKAGDKFSINIAELDMDEEEKFFLEIAFNEPGISEGEIILTVLKESLRRVQQLVSDFAPLLK
jgi:hypothetical protein